MERIRKMKLKRALFIMTFISLGTAALFSALASWGCLRIREQIAPQGWRPHCGLRRQTIKNSCCSALWMRRIPPRYLFFWTKCIASGCRKSCVERIAVCTSDGLGYALAEGGAAYAYG